jgi:AraC-like DNA-binding protein
MKTFKSHNLDHYLRELKEIDTQATQLSQGRFFCNKEAVTLPKIQINKWFVSTSMLYHGALVSDELYISFPLTNGALHVDGLKLESYEPLVMQQNKKVVVKYPSNTKSLDFIISRAVVNEIIKHESSDLSGRLEHKCKILLPNPARQRLSQEIIRSTLYFYNNIDSFNYQALLDFSDGLAISLSNFLSPAPSDLKEVGLNKRLTVIKRALDYVFSNFEPNLTVLELASRCYCSPRTLEYAFKTCLDITPKEYLVKRRLQMVRKKIQSTENESIQNILFDHGVTNLSRFITDYALFFGESPIATLRQNS